MQQQPGQLTIFTQQLERAAVVEQLSAEMGWKLSIVISEDQLDLGRLRQAAGPILIDLDWPDAIALFRRLAQELPGVPLLALTPPRQLVALQEIHLAGASGYVAYPINHDHFFATIEQVLQKSATPRPYPGRMIALVGLKGGVGRTTLAANLAIALHQQGAMEPVLAEVHHGLGQLPFLLNVQPRHTIASLLNEATIDPDLLLGYFQPHQSGIRLLLAPSEPAQVVELGVETWQRTLTLLTSLTSHVVVDTASAADGVLAEVLKVADELLVVTDPTVPSLCNARGLLDILRTEQTNRAILRLILNQADIKGGLTRAMVEEYLGRKIDIMVPFEPALATFSCNRGIPLVLSHPRTLFSRRVQQLAALLLHKSTAETVRQPANRLPFGSWFTRLQPKTSPG